MVSFCRTCELHSRRGREQSSTHLIPLQQKRTENNAFPLRGRCLLRRRMRCRKGAESERLFVNKKNVGRSYPCKQRTTLPRLRTPFAAKPRAGLNLANSTPKMRRTERHFLAKMSRGEPYAYK